MKTWQYVCICLFILIQCISFYGEGIKRGKQEYRELLTECIDISGRLVFTNGLLLDVLKGQRNEEYQDEDPTSSYEPMQGI